jgi:hypothetical protein
MPHKMKVGREAKALEGEQPDRQGTRLSLGIHKDLQTYITGRVGKSLASNTTSADQTTGTVSTTLSRSPKDPSTTGYQNTHHTIHLQLRSKTTLPFKA